MNTVQSVLKVRRKKRTKCSKKSWNRHQRTHRHRHYRNHRVAEQDASFDAVRERRRAARTRPDAFNKVERPLKKQTTTRSRSLFHRKHHGKVCSKASESPPISQQNGFSISTASIAKTVPSQSSYDTNLSTGVSPPADAVKLHRNDAERNFAGHINKIHAFIRQQVKNDIVHGDRLFDALAGVMPRSASRNAFDANPDRCRHPDVICLDKGRVTLNRAKDFIHANRVPTSEDGSEEMILTQLPLKNTVMDFWQMVWDENVQSILVLLTQAEWDHFGRNLRMIPDWRGCLHKTGGLCIVFQQEYVVSPVWSVKFYGLSWGGVYRCVQWIHYTGWPHDQVPSETNTIWQINSYLRRSKKPIVCMSMSGVGRAGTYAMLEMAHERLHNHNNKHINMAECLQKVRDTRMHAVQTRFQFNFLQMALVDHLLSCDRVRVDVKPDYVNRYRRMRSTILAKTDTTDDV